VLVAPVVRGIQSTGVIANAKHFVNNEIEDHRDLVSAQVDERTRFEIYYPPFQVSFIFAIIFIIWNNILNIGSS
jgi:beta-glucosidase